MVDVLHRRVILHSIFVHTLSAIPQLDYVTLYHGSNIVSLKWYTFCTAGSNYILFLYILTTNEIIFGYQCSSWEQCCQLLLFTFLHRDVIFIQVQVIELSKSQRKINKQMVNLDINFCE